MNSGYTTPLLDQFRRGEVDRQLRLEAASGALPIPSLDQLVLLELLSVDPDEDVRLRAASTLVSMPDEAIRVALASSDAPEGLREFVEACGGAPVAAAAGPEAGDATAAGEPGDRDAGVAPTSSPVMDRLKRAIRGGRQDRSRLIRDKVRVVAIAVLSSPKLSEQEVESFVRMTDVSEEVLRVIGNNRAWLRSYTVLSGLVRNPRTPIAVSLRLVQHLNSRDLKMLAIDRNVPDPVRAAAKRQTAVGQARRST